MKRPRSAAGALFHWWVKNQLYFSVLERLLNAVFRLLPRPWITAMMATDMPAATRPYSIAVAPDSSFAKRAIRAYIGF